MKLRLLLIFSVLASTALSQEEKVWTSDHYECGTPYNIEVETLGEECLEAGNCCGFNT